MDQFWDSTLLELNDLKESWVRSRKAEDKVKAGHVFVLANAITSRIAYFFSDEKSRKEEIILQPWQAYPEYFIDEEKLAEERKEKQEMDIQRQKVIDWVNHVNAQRHRKEEAE